MNQPQPGLLDFCPRCRIQAPHRPGRDACPRCHGPLSVISATTTPARQPQQTGLRARQAPAPRRQQRVFRNPNLNWIAQRPPEARPVQRRTPRPDGPGRSPIPSYRYIPRWGLLDAPAQWHSTTTPRQVADRQLTQVLTIAAGVFGFTALVHLLRYIVVSVNRSVVVPSWIDRGSTWLVVFGGVCAGVAALVGVIALARWILVVRADAYLEIGRLDPRPWWQTWPAVVLPVVNLVGPAWLIYEAKDLDADTETSGRTRRRMTRIWVGWLVVNLGAAVAIAYRFFGDTIQEQADGLFWVIVSAALSAAFCWWVRLRLPRLFDAPAPVAVKTRWVVAQ